MDTIDFPCINCQELIRQDRISYHSLFCVYPLDSVISIDEQPAPLQLIFRLGKLKSALTSHTTDTTSEVDKKLYEFLILQANEILAIEHPTEDCLDKCKAIISSLERYSKASLSTSVLLYNERLKVLPFEAVKVLE